MSAGTSSKLSRRMLTGAAAISALALLAACSSSSKPSSSSPATSGSSSAASSSSAAGASTAAGTSTAASSAASSGNASTVALPAAFQGKTLVVPAATGYPPYAYLDGSKILGIDPDLGVALGGPLGAKVTVKADSFENSLLGVSKGTYFIAPGADVTADREKTFDMVSFLEDHYEFMTLASAPTLGTTMDALCGLKVSTVAADSSIPVLQKESSVCTSAGKKAVSVLTFADQGAATLAVQSKQADATTATVTNLGYISKQAGGTFKTGGPAYSYVYIGIATAKGNGMAQAVAAAINVLIKNGEYRKILAKYGVEDASVTTAEVNPNPTPPAK
jgi:polar amino acid transport system substrate-binding protein